MIPQIGNVFIVVFVGDIFSRQFLLAFAQHVARLFGLALIEQRFGEEAEHAAVRLAHAHHGLVEVDALSLDVAEGEALHHVVVHLVGIYGAHRAEVERRDAVGKAFEHEEVFEAGVVVRAERDAHIHRALPVGAGEHFVNHDVHAIQSALLFVGLFEGNLHLVGDRVAGDHHARAAHRLFVHGKHEAVGGEIAALGTRHEMVEHVTEFVGVDRRVFFLYLFENAFIFGADGVERVLAVVYVAEPRPRDGQRGRVVGGAQHLVGVPVGLQVREVAHAGIRAVAFRFLIIPEGEGVVITVGKDDGLAVVGQRVQVVESEVAAGVAVGAVVVVPRLAHHLQRHENADDGSHSDCHGLLFQQAAQPVGDSSNAEANPNGERIERTGVGIVAFARLLWRLVKVEHNGQARHKEEEEHYPELPDAALALVGLPEEAEQAEE